MTAHWMLDMLVDSHIGFRCELVNPINAQYYPKPPYSLMSLKWFYGTEMIDISYCNIIYRKQVMTHEN